MIDDATVKELLVEYEQKAAALAEVKERLIHARTKLKEMLAQAEIDRKGSQDSGYNESARWVQ